MCDLHAMICIPVTLGLEAKSESHVLNYSLISLNFQHQYTHAKRKETKRKKTVRGETFFFRVFLGWWPLFCPCSTFDASLAWQSLEKRTDLNGRKHLHST